MNLIFHKTAVLAVSCTLICSSVSLGQKVFLRSFKVGTVTADSATYPPSNSISHMTVDTSGGWASVWIGTGNGLARSVSAGRSWTDYGSNSAFADAGIFSIASLENALVWSSTGHDEDVGGGSTVQTGSGYAFSTNGGLTWKHLRQTMDSRGDSIIAYGINDSLWILPVVVPEQNVTFDIALTPTTVWTTSWAGGLRKSVDSGKTWERVLLPTDRQNSLSPTDTLWTYAQNDPAHLHRIFPRLDPRNNNNFLGFGVYAVDDDTIWCGTAGGINKSTDGGKSWVKFNHQNESNGILGNWVISIKAQRLQGGLRIWTTNWKAVDNSEDFGVSFTDDGGLTWTDLLQGIRAYDFAFKDSICYIATDNGIFRTPDGGRSSVNFSNFADPETHKVILASPVYTCGVVNDTVIIGTGDGLARTIDNAQNPFGIRWEVDRTHGVLTSPADSYAYPNPFSPASEEIRIHYKLPDPASHTVRIDLFDFGMNRIKSLINATRSGSTDLDELWNGQDDHQRTVANGVYFYRIQFDGGGSPLYGKIIVLQ